MQPELDAASTMTLEAFADTIIPGAKRSPADHAIAGVSDDGGAVESGALEMLSHPAGGLADSIGGLAMMLDGHSLAYAGERGLTLDPALPPFVALPYPDRIALVAALTAPDHPEKPLWVGMALFANMAYDSAAHMSTHEALAAGHPGLTAMRYSQPDLDGLWRFADFSYGRQLADPHPHTTPTGSPA